MYIIAFLTYSGGILEMDPFEEWQRSVRRVQWAFENMHIVLAGSAVVGFVFQLALAGILS